MQTAGGSPAVFVERSTGYELLDALELPLSPPGIMFDAAWLRSAVFSLTVSTTRPITLRTLATAPLFFGLLRFLERLAAFFAGAAAFFAGAFLAAFFGAAFRAGARLADFFAGFFAAFFADFFAGAFFEAFFEAVFLLDFFAVFFEDFFGADFFGADFFAGFEDFFGADFLDFLAAMDSLLFKTIGGEPYV